MVFFRKRPHTPEAPPWWANTIYKRLGLILKKQDTTMNQIEELSTEVSSLRGKFSQISDAMKAQSALQPQEPDLSGPISEVRELAAQADALLASLQGAPSAEVHEEAPADIAPASQAETAPSSAALAAPAL